MSEAKKKYTVIYPECSTLITLTATTPSGAAKKAYSKCIRHHSEYNKKHIIKLQNENGKLFEYEVYAVKKNGSVMRGDKKIKYTYNVVVKSRNIHKSKNKIKKSKSNSTSKIKSKSKTKSKSKSGKRIFWINPKKKKST